MNIMTKMKQMWMLAAILTCSLCFVSCRSEDTSFEEKQQLEAEFQSELDKVMALA